MRSRSSWLTMSTSAAMFSGLLALASAAPAFAQPAAAAKPAQPAAAPAKPAKHLTDRQKKAEAKKLYHEAEEKFDKGDYAGALPLYIEADGYVPGPPPKYKAAACKDKLGQVVDAVAAYQKYLDSKPDPERFKTQIADANTRIEALKKTPAKVKVATVPDNPPNLRIAVDNAPAPGRELSMSPGHHKITVTADGYAAATQEIDVTFAESKDVSVTLTEQAPPPVAAVPPPPPVEPTPTPVEPVQPPAEPRSPIPAYVTLGLAGVGAVVGTIFGISALGAKSDFEATPTTENADAVDRNALIADMSFAVALTFGVTGAVLLMSSDGSSEAPDAAPPPAAARRNPIKKAFVAPYVSPTGGGAAARLTF